MTSKSAASPTPAPVKDGTIATGLTPLHVAASQGDVEVIKRLLQSGSVASVDAQDDLQGNTALHEAAWKGYSQTIEVLMKYKANPYIKNKGGFTPLHLACQQGHNESARILLLHKCKPDVKNNYGDTPLHTSCRYGHAGVARILISAFCDVSPVNKNGDSPLHITAAMGRRKLTKILLSSGCNPTLKNCQGETAMDIALRKNLKEIQEIIANPPPLRDLMAGRDRHHRPRSKSTSCKMEEEGGGNRNKKREKESSLEGSKSSGGRQRQSRKDLLRQKKTKMGGSSKSVQFLGGGDGSSSILAPANSTTGVVGGKEEGLHQQPHSTTSLERKQIQTVAADITKSHYNQANGSHHHHQGEHILHADSPYGCPQSPVDLADFPKLKIDSIPTEKLDKGEQYYIDLSGTIKKGPRPVVTACNCKPLFKRVERKMDSNKQELKEHIDCRHDHLKQKIRSLEKKTTDMSETFKEKIASERADCIDRLQSLPGNSQPVQQQLQQLPPHVKCPLDVLVGCPGRSSSSLGGHPTSINNDPNNGTPTTTNTGYFSSSSKDDGGEVSPSQSNNSQKEPIPNGSAVPPPPDLFKERVGLYGETKFQHQSVGPPTQSTSILEKIQDFERRSRLIQQSQQPNQSQQPTTTTSVPYILDVTPRPYSSLGQPISGGNPVPNGISNGVIYTTVTPAHLSAARGKNNNNHQVPPYLDLRTGVLVDYERKQLLQTQNLNKNNMKYWIEARLRSSSLPRPSLQMANGSLNGNHHHVIGLNSNNNNTVSQVVTSRHFPVNGTTTTAITTPHLASSVSSTVTPNGITSGFGQISPPAVGGSLSSTLV